MQPDVTMNDFGGRRAPLITAIAGSALVAAAAIYVAAHWFWPSDGATLDFSQAPPAAGLPLLIWHTTPGGLQSGDVVLALDGRRLDDWVAPRPGSPALPGGGQWVYRIERAGQGLDVLVPLQPYDFFAALGGNWTELLALGYLWVVAVVVFVLRPALPGARALFLVSSAILASSVVYFLGLQVTDLRQPWLVWLWIWSTVVLFGVAMAGLLHFSLVFPRVRPVIARRPALLGLVYVGAWLPYLAVLAAHWSTTGGAAARLSLIVRSTGAITTIYFILVLANTLIGYRMATTDAERRQLRWLVWAFYVAEVPWIVLSAGPAVLELPPVVPLYLLGSLWFAIPTAFAIAVLREQLFDIDLIIRRTLVYSILTAALALVYFASVVLLQSGFIALTGQTQSTLATVLSTLAIAYLFVPVRRRVQALIDRRFYRRKYDASRALAGFGATLRDHVDLDQLSDRLVAVVNETMEPAEVSLLIMPYHSDHQTDA